MLLIYKKGSPLIICRKALQKNIFYYLKTFFREVTHTTKVSQHTALVPNYSRV